MLADLLPVLPLLHDLLAVQEHHAEDDAGRETAPLLAVVNLKGLPHVQGQSAVQLMLELIDVVLCTS